VLFDLKSTLHAARRRELALVLGYNTALFSAWYRARGVPSIMNMDGMDRLRPKWRFPVRQFFALNEWLGPVLSNHLVADHPVIADYHAARVDRSRISTIAYGADAVTDADRAEPERHGLVPGAYVLVVCRPETGHSLSRIVRAFSRRRRTMPLVVLGDYGTRDGFQRHIRSLASDQVVFPGAVYDRPRLEALRFHAALYVHGHRFGGTNPSLVEALAAGSPVLARDNAYNRWVAGEGAGYFETEEQCAAQFDRLLDDRPALAAMSAASRRRHAEAFTWKDIADRYEEVLLRWLPA